MMQNTPVKPAGSNRNGTPRGSGIMAALKAILLHNWGFKLLSIFLALLLWAGLISQDPTLTREKTFTNVPINIVGMDALKRSGFVVVSGLDEAAMPRATVVADVPQNQYDQASVSTYSTRIELGNIKEAGTLQLKVKYSNSLMYGNVVSVSPATVEVVIEEYLTRYRIPVTLKTIGEAPEGYYVGSATLDPPTISVSGPRSVIDTILRAEAVMDLSTLEPMEGTVRTAVPFTLKDSSGATVQNSMLEITGEGVLLDSVIVEQTMYAVDTLPLNTETLITGTPADGYRVASFRVEPDIIAAAGSRAVLDSISCLYPDGTVSVNNRMESFHQTVRIKRPSGIVTLIPDSVTVSVYIEPVIENRTFSGIGLNVVNNDKALVYSLEPLTVDVTVTGEKLALAALKSTQFVLTLDLTGYGEGTHEVPVLCEVRYADPERMSFAVSPATVTVTMKQK